MAEQQSPQTTAGAASDQPVFHVEKLYLKDLSFESPNAPESCARGEEPRVEFNLDSQINPKGDERFEVALHVTIQVFVEQETLFLVETTYAGLFLTRNIPKDHLSPLLNIECPSILFPYVRQVISECVLNGGFKPMVLDPINFSALYQQRLQEQQAAGTTTGAAPAAPTVQ